MNALLRLPTLHLAWCKQWKKALIFSRFDVLNSLTVLRMYGENVNSCVKWPSKSPFMLFV